LIDWCFTARQHKIGQFVPIYHGGLLAQAFDNRRHVNVYYTKADLAVSSIVQHIAV